MLVIVSAIVAEITKVFAQNNVGSLETNAYVAFTLIRTIVISCPPLTYRVAANTFVDAVGPTGVF
jgi:hypothetical protein